jgi:hypothetical protein
MQQVRTKEQMTHSKLRYGLSNFSASSWKYLVESNGFTSTYKPFLVPRVIKSPKRLKNEPDRIIFLENQDELAPPLFLTYAIGRRYLCPKQNPL